MKFSTLIKEIVAAVSADLAAIETDQFQHKPRPEKWSKQELVGHLIDSAYNNHQRFVRASSQDSLNFQGYNPDEWVIKNRYQQRSKEEVLTLWATVNLHMAEVIEGIHADELYHKTVDHNFHLLGVTEVEEKQPSSLAYLIWDYIAHLEYHMAQLLPDYQKRLQPFETYQERYGKS